MCCPATDAGSPKYRLKGVGYLPLYFVVLWFLYNDYAMLSVSIRKLAVRTFYVLTHCTVSCMFRKWHPNPPLRLCLLQEHRAP